MCDARILWLLSAARRIAGWNKKRFLWTAKHDQRARAGHFVVLFNLFIQKVINVQRIATRNFMQVIVIARDVMTLKNFRRFIDTR